MKVHTGYQTNKFCKEPPQLYRRRGGVKTGEAKVLTFRNMAILLNCAKKVPLQPSGRSRI
jgi:hypothetical protein